MSHRHFCATRRRRRYGYLALFAAAVLLVPTARAAPSAVGAHAPEPAEARFDPPSGPPFRWHEILRLDLRPGSPVTERSLIVAPAAPLPVGRRHRAAVLATYRNDRFQPDLDGPLGGRDAHRFEVGLPSSFRIAKRWAWDVDPRAVFGSDFSGPAAGEWYPWVRTGLSWAARDDLILGASLLFTRGPLGLIPVPLFSASWEPRHLPLRVDALAPRYVEAAARIRRVELFGTFHWQTLVWGMDTDPRPGGERLLRQEVRLHAGARVRVFGPLGLEAAAQWVPWQQVELRGNARAFTQPEDVALTLSVVLDKLAGD